MRIFNNVNSVNTQNSISMNTALMAKSLEKLSSGLRINRASDDSAGLSVSETLRAQIRGSDMARRNSNDALAMLQVAEGGAQEIVNNLQRMRELALQSANSTYTNTDRAYMQSEYTALSSEITRIANATNYNGISLLSSSSVFTFQVSSASGVGTGSAASTISFTAVSLGSLSVGAVSTQSVASSAVALIDTALASTLSLRSDIGSTMNRLERTVSNLGVTITNLTDAESRIRDVDFAQETTQFTRNQILVQSATSMLAQANQLPSGVLGLLQ